MKLLSINAKLILGNLCYAIPILVLIQQVIGVYESNIQFAVWEQKGLVYQKPLEETFEHLGQHAWLAQRAQHGDKVAESEMQTSSNKIDEGIRAIEKVQEDLGVDLQFTTDGLGKRQRSHLEISNLKKEWNDLKNNSLSLKSSDSIEQHNHLISDIRGMIAHLGDTSNLILDPDLDSYYLMDVTLGALPQMQERLVGIITRGEQIIRRKTVTPEDFKWLISTSSFLKQSDFDRAAGDTQTSLNEDANFYGASPTLQSRVGAEMANLKKLVEPLVAMLDELSSSPTVTLKVGDFLNLAEGTFKASFVFWHVGDEELNKLFQIRINDQIAQKNKSLKYGIFALILATLMSTFFGISIRRGIINNIKSVTNRLSESGELVTKTSHDLSAIAHTISASTQQQAATMEETSASLYEIRQMITSNISSAESSGTLAEDISTLVGETGHWMDELQTAMKSIFESNERISALAKIIEEIGDKTEVIDDIVFKTQLLSFNASVEAERAGEYGRGFSVVAQEVGNLAQMSGKAATEIANIVKNSIREANAVSTDNRERVHRGETLTQETAARMTGMNAKIQLILQAIQKITQASREQGEGVNQISTTVENLNNITQENASLAEKCSSSSEHLASQGENLLEVINELISLVEAKRNLKSEELGSDADADANTDTDTGTGSEPTTHSIATDRSNGEKTSGSRTLKHKRTHQKIA